MKRLVACATLCSGEKTAVEKVERQGEQGRGTSDPSTPGFRGAGIHLVTSQPPTSTTGPGYRLFTADRLPSKDTRLLRCEARPACSLQPLDNDGDAEE